VTVYDAGSEAVVRRVGVCLDAVLEPGAGSEHRRRAPAAGAAAVLQGLVAAVTVPAGEQYEQR